MSWHLIDAAGRARPTSRLSRSHNSRCPAARTWAAGLRPTRRLAIVPASNATLFYRTQAEAARTRSDEATLQNVRENFLRAAEAWDLLAARSDKSDRLRAEEALRKAATLEQA